MVTKLFERYPPSTDCFVLAKKLMVTKHPVKRTILNNGFVLAKKLMVTKL